MSVPSTTSYGGAFSIGATALAITGVAIPSWTASTVGDATVTAGLWAVCSVSVPFIDDMCDGIIEPSPSLIGARFLSVLQCVVGFLTICWAALTVILLPYSAMLFVTLLFTIASAVLGVFAVITFASTAHPVVLRSEATMYGTAFLVYNVAWVLFLIAAALTLHAYVVKRREAIPARINRKGWAAAKRAGRAMGRATGGKR